MASIESEVSWCAGIVFLFLLPNWGHVAGRSESDLGGTVRIQTRSARQIFFVTIIMIKLLGISLMVTDQ